MCIRDQSIWCRDERERALSSIPQEQATGGTGYYACVSGVLRRSCTRNNGGNTTRTQHLHSIGGESAASFCPSHLFPHPCIPPLLSSNSLSALRSHSLFLSIPTGACGGVL